MLKRIFHRHHMTPLHRGMIRNTFKCLHCGLEVESEWQAVHYHGRFPRFVGWAMAVGLSLLCYALLVLVLVWSFSGPAKADSLEVHIYHDCIAYRYGCPVAGHGQVQHPPAPTSEQDRQELEARALKWEAYCKPTPVWNGRVYQMQYAHKDCDLGRSE